MRLKVGIAIVEDMLTVEEMLVKSGVGVVKKTSDVVATQAEYEAGKMIPS